MQAETGTLSDQGIAIDVGSTGDGRPLGAGFICISLTSALHGPTIGYMLSALWCQHGALRGAQYPDDAQKAQAKQVGRSVGD